MIEAALANDTDALLALLGVGNGPGGKGPLTPLNPGSGGDKLPDMEARINKLEEHVGNIRVDVGVIKTDVAHLPSKDYIRETLRNQLVGVSIIVGIIGTIVGVAVHFLPH